MDRQPVNCPPERYATTWTWYPLGGWKTDARFEACTLGALADRKPALSFCATFEREGSAPGMTNAARIHAMTTNHRNLTANLPIPVKIPATTTWSPRGARAGQLRNMAVRDRSTLPRRGGAANRAVDH